MVAALITFEHNDLSSQFSHSEDGERKTAPLPLPWLDFSS